MSEDKSSGISGSGISGLGGLVNMGMTCYANAAIQCIRHCKKIPWLCRPGHCDSLFEPEGNVKEKRANSRLLSAVSMVETILSVTLSEGENQSSTRFPLIRKWWGVLSSLEAPNRCTEGSGVFPLPPHISSNSIW